MTRRAWVGCAAIFGLIACWPIAWAIGETPERFFTSTLPRAIGAGVGLVLFVLICAGIVAQVSRR